MATLFFGIIIAFALKRLYAFLDVQILPAVCFIDTITFGLSAIGVKMGSICGAKFQSKAELLGGIILILLGTKILLKHLNILSI